MSDSDGEQRRSVNGCEVIQKENRYGVMKDHIEVTIGTTVFQVPRHIRNPTTDRRHDLTKLSEDGYLKPFLALHHHYANHSQDIIHLGSAPILSFDKDRFEYREKDGHHLLVKREAETKFEEAVLENDRSLHTGNERSDQ